MLPPRMEQLGFLNTRVRHGYICRYPRPSLGRLSTPERSPLEKVGRGGGYLGVLSVISLALLLPTLSLSPPCTLPFPSSQSHEPGHVRPRGQRVRRVAWRPSTAPSHPLDGT